jgi:hypothetical protein
LKKVLQFFGDLKNLPYLCTRFPLLKRVISGKVLKKNILKKFPKYLVVSKIVLTFATAFPSSRRR